MYPTAPIEMDSVIAAAKPAASRTGLEPPPAMTPRMIPRIFTSPSWPPRMTSRSQFVWRCRSRWGERPAAATFAVVSTTRPSRVFTRPESVSRSIALLPLSRIGR